MKIRPVVLLPLIFAFALFALFGYALFSGVDPKEVPSALTGKRLPTFQLASLQDEQQTLTREDIVGEPMLLNIWATWCSSCKYEHPVLNALSASGVKIIGINYKDERDLALTWLHDYADPYVLDLFDPNGDLGFDLGVTGAPETFFIDSKGQVQYRYQGPITHEIWQESLKAIYDEMV